MLYDRAGPGAGTGRRRRVAARTRLDFWFDAVLLLGYTLAYSYGFTGIAIWRSASKSGVTLPAGWVCASV